MADQAPKPIKVTIKKKGKKWVIVLSVFIVMILCGYIVRATRKVRCAEFNTQGEAQKAFLNGARYLDANHDMIACNALLKKK